MPDDCRSESERKVFALLGTVPPRHTMLFSVLDCSRLSGKFMDVISGPENTMIHAKTFDAMMARFENTFNGKSVFSGGDILYSISEDKENFSAENESGEH